MCEINWMKVKKYGAFHFCSSTEYAFVSSVFETFMAEWKDSRDGWIDSLNIGC